VFHSSGVTRRTLEIQKLLNGHFEYTQKDDFVKKGLFSAEYQKRELHIFLKDYLKVLAFKIGFVKTLNVECDYLTLSQLLVSTRGHYSHISLSGKELKFLATLLHLNVGEYDAQLNGCSIHLRLGDLLELPTKNPIDVGRILGTIPKQQTFTEITFFSDSSADEVSKLIKSQDPDFKYSIESLGTHEVIKACVTSYCFIGTNSKISIWIALFRMFFFPERKSFLPVELRPNFTLLIGYLNVAKDCIVFY
jgi:hypothetical protein